MTMTLKDLVLLLPCLFYLSVNGDLNDDLSRGLYLNNESMVIRAYQASSGNDIQFSHYPEDCAEYYLTGYKYDGIYEIWPREDGGGWTVFQKRGDYTPLVDFYRTWLEYKRGFGDLERQYWLGNDRLSMLTNQDSYRLRIDLEDFDRQKRFAVYHSFSVSNELDKYRMSLGMYLNGDAGDSLYIQNDQRFSTKDQDNDSGVRDCAKVFNGAWWYNDCHQTNLNGGYLRGYHPTVLGTGVSWYLFRGNNYSLKSTEMKIRPIWFKP
ncbi:unnamed protein product [Didymodactylos carnosus]|uniref:Fibrinogen C-terminal domain-containing protein n=1 Tax=Didymodactylos carnosus TaxID=1234261 RepID=A0A815NMU6_9BILA|nr:unnamed protein product [Didymodactylos carnosus]CAF4312109.1 unnamed protein product [Didymodactylos carnosus]